MKIGFTGSRHGMTQHQKEQLILNMQEFSPTEFHHGDCIGADAEAHDIVREFFKGVRIVIHPPHIPVLQAHKRGDESRVPCSYLKRDKRIVEETDVLFGAPLTDKELSSGTWATIRIARKLSHPLLVLKR